ncbi:TetR/AcrR family transcriptional regulator [Micromonospora sp. NPDC049559]|uniref:TetR/AcrR family transcriptional regulator n=1 Tax=Micromonospora sp. NPDC049559 TaxID=3155923 RepID=UPI00341F9878
MQAGESTTTGNTRDRLVGVALELFTGHGFAGTSLQMIADRLGITKAAVYHHFKTRDEILAAVIEPVFEEARRVIAAAAALHTPSARAEAMLTGWVDLAIRHRALIAFIAAEPCVKPLLDGRADGAILLEQPRELLCAHHPGPAGQVNAELALCGIAAAITKPALSALDDETLRRYMLESGRRLLGLRRPRNS